MLLTNSCIEDIKELSRMNNELRKMKRIRECKFNKLTEPLFAQIHAISEQLKKECDTPIRAMTIAVNEQKYKVLKQTRSIKIQMKGFKQ